MRGKLVDGIGCGRYAARIQQEVRTRGRVEVVRGFEEHVGNDEGEFDEAIWEGFACSLEAEAFLAGAGVLPASLPDYRAPVLLAEAS